MMLRPARWIVACLALLVMAGARAYEPAPRPNLSQVLDPELKQSPHHAVEEVDVDGAYYRFRIDSDLGTYVVPSLAMLRIRVNEIRRLSQALSEFDSKEEHLSEELRGQFRVSANNAIDILAQPVSTAADLAGQVAQDLNQTFKGEPQPGGASAPTAPAYGESGYEDPVISMHKRNVAAQWGLDVYSSNPRVQAFLDAVAKARSGGRISAGAPSLITNTQKPTNIEDPQIDTEVARRLKQSTPQELLADDAARLRSMQIPAALVQRFLRHPAFSPRHKTRITHYLGALDDVINRAAFLEAAVDAQDEGAALAYEQAAMMLHDYDVNVHRLAKLYSADGVVRGITSDGRIAYFLPVDVVYWDKAAEREFDGFLESARHAGFTGWDAVVAGDVSGDARAAMEKRSFTVRADYVH